jgi:hypothetical protein
VSHTSLLDRPAAGRAFFDWITRDHLYLGPPDQVVIIFEPAPRLSRSRVVSHNLINRSAGPTAVLLRRLGRHDGVFQSAPACVLEWTSYPDERGAEVSLMALSTQAENDVHRLASHHEFDGFPALAPGEELSARVEPGSMSVMSPADWGAAGTVVRS